MNFWNWHVARPTDWKGRVLHEFGHVFGFRHEHQHAACRDEIRWKPGPNGEMSIFQYTKKHYEWDELMTLTNFNTFNPSKDDEASDKPDKLSIMHYPLPAEVLISGEESPCAAGSNQELRPSNYDALAKIYERSKQGASPAFLASERAEKIETYASRPTVTGEQKMAALQFAADIRRQVVARVFVYTSTQQQLPFVRNLAHALPPAIRFGGKSLLENNRWAVKEDEIQVRILRNPESEGGKKDETVATEVLRIIQQELAKSNMTFKSRVSYTEKTPKPEKAGDIEVWLPTKFQPLQAQLGRGEYQNEIKAK